jgi:nucleotide-binding universal stress UspA family protein
MSTPTLGRILVAFDGSDSALKACEMAALLAKNLDSEVGLLYVVPTLSIFSAPLADNYYVIQEERAEDLVRKGMAVFEKRGVKARSEVVRAHWSIVETIINYAYDKRSDVILMGARGLGGFKKMLIGSVSSGVVQHAQCPVLIIR